MLVYVAGADAVGDAQPLIEDGRSASSSELPSDLVFEAIAATLPDAGSVDELRERSEPGFVFVV